MSTGPIIQCAQCGAAIIAPQWSEYLSDDRVRNVWSCEDCGYEFEHTIYLAARQSAKQTGISQH
jgi:DNA-directed RNA polymerase subunit M/transcription elongation factor TFIIS